MAMGLAPNKALQHPDKRAKSGTCNLTHDAGSSLAVLSISWFSSYYVAPSWLFKVPMKFHSLFFQSKRALLVSQCLCVGVMDGEVDLPRGSANFTCRLVHGH